MRDGQRHDIPVQAKQAAPAGKRGFRVPEPLADQREGPQDRAKAGTGNLEKLRRIAAGLDEAALSGLRKLMNKRELAILDGRVLADDTLEKIGDGLGLTKERVRQLERDLLAKAESWMESGHFRKNRKKGKRIRQMQAAVEERLSDGDTLDHICGRAGLDGLERKVLELCVLAEYSLTVKEAGKKLGCFTSDVQNALRHIESNLQAGGREYGRSATVRRIRSMIEQRSCFGESREELAERAGLDDFERQVLDTYALAEGRMTARRAGKELEVSTSLVQAAYRRIKTKLSR